MHHCIIIGSGLVGSAMAVALAKAGMVVDLVEAKPREERLASQYDGRTSAIAYGSVKVLESLGVWQRIDDKCAITDIRVCEEGGAHFVHYDYRDAGNEPFGYIVENRLLRSILCDAMDECEAITLHEPTTIDTFEADTNTMHVTLDNGDALTAPLMLVADGKFSTTRSMAGIDIKRNEYGQTAMVATIEHTEPHHGLAVEAFYPVGPFAILPMTHNRSNIVWTEKDAMADYYFGLDDETFLAEIHKRVGDHLGELSLVGPRHRYPLMLIRANRYVDDRLALIGDAGHGIHPIAGQGVNLGYRDVALLAEILINQARLGLDLGDPALLQRYEAARRADIQRMSMATDGLNRLFSNSVWPLKAARDMGLGMVERMPPVKQFFMRQAMGISDQMPKMMRGEAP